MTGLSYARPDDAVLAAELVTGAGEVAHRRFRGAFEVSTKSNDTDVVTQADHEAEAYVLRRLATERPLDAVLGEEGSVRDGTSGRRWVIDPVDGTYNFVRGMDAWCSALALTEGDELRLGAVHDAVRRETTVGGLGLGVRVNGEELPPLDDTPLGVACAATYLHPSYLGTDVGDAWLRAVSGMGTYRLLGSGTLELTAVARGRLDLFLHHSVPDWDRLPGQALVEALGGDTRLVAAGGVEWFVAGAPSAVAEACDRLADG